MNSVLDLLDRTCGKYASRTAIICEEESLTYGELSFCAQKIASGILDELTASYSKKPIMFFLEKSCDAIVVMYAIIYSGNFYVPVDTKTPADRLESICATLKEMVIITDKIGQAKLEEIGYKGKNLLIEELVERECHTALLKNVRKNIKTEDLMYVIFTSGSTGVPKGVAINNAAFIDYMEALNILPVTEEDVWGNQAPFYTDFSLRDIYYSMTSGGTMVIIPQSYFLSPGKLLRYLEKNKVSVLAWVPTAYGIVSKFNALAKVKPEHLRLFVFSGESMPIPVFNYWKNCYKEATFYQMYGPTEATGASTYYRVEGCYNDGETIPIGKPFDNTEIYLLNAGNIVSKTEVGISGEICIAGRCLADGYYNNPEKTDQAFSELVISSNVSKRVYHTGDVAYYNESGNLIFVSRIDYQVKHGGRRIELGEIESCAYKITQIKQCCCVQNRNTDTLILYYTGDISGDEVKVKIRELVPIYMIPGQCVYCDSLPMLPNGKLNRKELDERANEL